MPAGDATALQSGQWRAWAIDVIDRRAGRLVLRSVTLHVAPAASFTWSLADSAQVALLYCQVQLAVMMDLFSAALLAGCCWQRMFVAALSRSACAERASLQTAYGNSCRPSTDFWLSTAD